MSPKDTVPPPLSARDKFGFAYKTIKDRLPVILVKELEGDTLNEIQDDGKSIVAGIAKLRKELETNKPTELFDSLNLPNEFDYFNQDVELWNKALKESMSSDGTLPCWFDSAWLLVECYLYRRLKDIVLQTKHLKMFDPFIEIKQQATLDSIPSMKPIADRLCESQKIILESEKQTHPSERTEFTTFMHLALWANKCDLSINMMTVKKGKEDKRSIRERLDDLRENILCDSLSDAWFKFQDIKSKASSIGAKIAQDSTCENPIYIDLVSDNSGYELFVDLCLIHFLGLMLSGTNEKQVIKFRIHVKRMPWFVSDTTKVDLHSLVELLAKQADPSLNILSDNWASYLKKATWEIHEHQFWTLPYDYSEMKSNSPDLYETLSNSSMIIFKGDLNYRKLVGDRKWHILTPFNVALRGFEPAPLLALRTCKADVVVGIEDIQIFSNINNNELPRDWMVSGDYALIQCHLP